MTSKEYIFAALRNADVEPAPMPDLAGLEASALTFPDREKAFAEAVANAGGVISDEIPNDGQDSFTVRGNFGVAENGCVWIADGSFEDRRDLFIHERLVIMLSRNEIVDNMHQAYARLGEKASGYGIFISGPSKTADIEQALVLGAHGPRSLVMVFED